MNEQITGKRFVITGTLDSMTKNQVTIRLRELNGTLDNKLTKSTDCLIVGKNPGSKLQDAKQQNVRQIGEFEFLQWLLASTQLKEKK